MVVKTSFNTDCLLMSGKISIFAHSRNRSVATKTKRRKRLRNASEARYENNNENENEKNGTDKGTAGGDTPDV